MNGKKNNRILLSPLDWGLGHTTRCIPLIRYLQQPGREIVLAAEGASAKLLAAELPGIEIKELPGYNIRYAAGNSLVGTMMRQLPHIFNTIRRENQWLKELLKKEKFQLIISDNRPGFYHQDVHSIYITHQLRIKSGTGKLVDDLLQKVHARYMNPFNEVWIPDLAGEQNLAGELSHPSASTIKPNYIGLLSRFEKEKACETIYDLLILLSGPEPQRSILEQKMANELKSFNGSVLLVRGLPAAETNSFALPHVKVINHLPAEKLQQAIASSRQIICRSGYTSLMDLMKMQKSALLVPTPGQAEQEYLANYMQQQHYFPYITQQEFSLELALQKLSHFNNSTFLPDQSFEQYQTIVDQTIAKLC